MRILKLGDPHYSESLKQPTSSFQECFPQREQYLLPHVQDVSFETFKHDILFDMEVVFRERERLNLFLKSKSYDFLMVDNPLSALIIDRDQSVPIIFDCIDWYDEVYLKEFGVNKRYYLLRYGLLDLVERADRIVAQSPLILEALKVWGLRTSRVAVIPNGYDAQLFYARNEEEILKNKASIKERFGIELLHKKVVVYSGRLSPWYDTIKLVADAVSESTVFLIVGDGPLLKEIPERSNIIKCGALPVEEVAALTSVANVLVFPVEADCSPIVVSEYLAQGKPIVMPRGRIEWLLKDGETGFLVDNNSYAWRRGIENAAAQGEVLGKRNLEIARDLSWERLGERFSHFLHDEPVAEINSWCRS